MKNIKKRESGAFTTKVEVGAKAVGRKFMHLGIFYGALIFRKLFQGGDVIKFIFS